MNEAGKESNKTGTINHRQRALSFFRRHKAVPPPFQKFAGNYVNETLRKDFPSSRRNHKFRDFRSANNQPSLQDATRDKYSDNEKLH